MLNVACSCACSCCQRKFVFLKKKKTICNLRAPTQDNTHAPEKIDATGTKNKTSLYYYYYYF